MLIPSLCIGDSYGNSSLSRRVNANSQRAAVIRLRLGKLIKKGEC